ncbi:MAG: Rieske (2Fe-2S) protein, partial [Myxococcota bacterium]
MRNRPYGREQAPPPSFEEATNKRQKARAAGLDPNHWYVVARVSDLQPGDKREVVFWKRSVVLFRTEQGAFHALENRCAHRQIKLSKGEVEGCKLVCQYHGWKYDGTGRVVELSHDTFGHDIVNLRIPSYAVRLRYGFVWVFFGDQSRAASTPIPEIPELEVGSGWTSITCEFRWQAHHSMVLENVSDYTHEYLHRKTEPFRDARLKECSGEGDLIDVTYEAKIGASKLMNLFVDRQKAASGEMRLQYDYPYNRSNTDN